MHFALVFPERRGALWPKLLGVYSVPAALLALHIFVATAMLDFLPSIGSRDFLDTVELFYLGVYFLLAAAIFLASYLRAPERRAAAAAEVGHGRHVRGHPPVLPALCAAAAGDRGRRSRG